MAGFKLDNFRGVRPRASDVRLEVGEAVTALDVDLRRGLLRPRAKQAVWVAGADPALPILNDGDVTLLLRGDGEDGATTFPDSSPYDNTATAFAGAKVSTTQKKYGTGSIALVSDGDHVIVPAVEGGPLDIFQGDFTIEMWVYPTNVTSQRVIFAHSWVGATTGGIRVFFNSGKLTVQCDPLGWSDIISSNSVSANTWIHIAVCRQGNFGFICLDGQVRATSTANWVTRPVVLSELMLGGSVTSGLQGTWLRGYVDGVRITRGLARYTSAYTPPTAAFAAPANPQTLYRFPHRGDDTDYWMYFSSDVDIVPGPAESAEQRHYYTGDGYPKMFTADSIDDPDPPYPEDADTKYPYTWFKLGVPAPTAAPVLDVEALPEPSEGSVGLITGVSAQTLLININNNLQTNSGLNHGACGEDGRWAGVDIANIRPQGGTQTLTCLQPSTRVRVTEIVDGDHVKVVASGRVGPIEDMGMVPDSSNWRWDSVADDAHKHSWLTRLNSTAKRKSFILLPEEVTLQIDNHILRVGDIIRITGSASPMSVTLTEDIVTTPVPSDRWVNHGYRTGTLEVTDTFEFSGATSFMIERDGSSIDPVVPATADFEVESRSYVYTYVSHLGEESAPSPPSDPVTIRVGDEVDIVTFAAPPTERRNIDRIWVYRTNTGTEGTAFQYVGEVLVSDIASGFTDDVPNDELGEVLETEGWDVPDEGMVGLVAMPNGFLAGFFHNVLCFSEPGFPHAWPTDYRQALDFDIVGLEVFGNALYVTTKGKPYVAVGVHPLQMSVRRVETGQSCVDKRSMVNMGDRILYSSPEGLISAMGGSFVNVTEKHYTKEQWQQVVGPDEVDKRSVRAWYYDSQYILFASYTIDSVTTTTKLVFDFRDGPLRITSFSEPITAAYSDPETAELYYTVDEDDQPSGTPLADHRMLLRWDYEHPDADPGTGYSEGDYTTGQYTLPRPMALSCARVQCRRVQNAAGTVNTHGHLQVTVRGRRYDMWGTNDTPAEDDIVLVTATVIDGVPGDGSWVGEQRSAPFRIPVNTLVDSLRFELHVEGAVELEAVQLGESMEDLEPT